MNPAHTGHSRRQGPSHCDPGPPLAGSCSLGQGPGGAATVVMRVTLVRPEVQVQVQRQVPIPGIGNPYNHPILPQGVQQAPYNAIVPGALVWYHTT